MEIPGVAKTTIKIEDTGPSSASFSFFLEPPDCSVSLQEFEDHAVARLKCKELANHCGVIRVAVKRNEIIVKEMQKL